MNTLVLAFAVAGAAISGLAGCGHRNGWITLAHGAVTVSDREVRIHRSGGPDATIRDGGELTIGTEPVVLSTDQKAAAAAYYAAAIATGKHRIETGKAGADAGMAAAKEVVNGLVHGDTSQIGPRVEAKANEVKRQALHICEDLATLRVSQETLAGSLTAFQPYAVITAGDVAGCGQEKIG